MKIYTKTGDAGETGLFGGGRVAKDHPRVAAYGAVDELNATLGLAVTSAQDSDELANALLRVQAELFTLGADLATPASVKSDAIVRLSPDEIAALEQEIDGWEAGLTPLTTFILPGGCELAARLHLSRTVCRRAEREVITLIRQEAIGDTPRVYLNRLSDWLFVAARQANALAGEPDMPWHSPRQSARQSD